MGDHLDFEGVAGLSRGGGLLADLLMLGYPAREVVVRDDDAARLGTQALNIRVGPGRGRRVAEDVACPPLAVVLEHKGLELGVRGDAVLVEIAHLGKDAGPYLRVDGVNILLGIDVPAAKVVAPHYVSHLLPLVRHLGEHEDGDYGLARARAEHLVLDLDLVLARDSVGAGLAPFLAEGEGGRGLAFVEGARLV